MEKAHNIFKPLYLGQNKMEKSSVAAFKKLIWCIKDVFSEKDYKLILVYIIYV